jgi:hypothetical protein
LAKEDNENDLLSSPLVVNNGSVSALPDNDCFWRVYSLRWLQFANCVGGGSGGGGAALSVGEMSLSGCGCVDLLVAAVHSIS